MTKPTYEEIVDALLIVYAEALNSPTANNPIMRMVKHTVNRLTDSLLDTAMQSMDQEEAKEVVEETTSQPLTRLAKRIPLNQAKPVKSENPFKPIAQNGI